jgi:hypothetical protein
MRNTIGACRAPVPGRARQFRSNNAVFRNFPRGCEAPTGSSSARAPRRDVTVNAHNAGPPWDAKMFREHVLKPGLEPLDARLTTHDPLLYRRWAAINHFSDSDLEIDEKSRALQRSITRFEQTYYAISIGYWSVWLAALLSGNSVLTSVSGFSVFCWAMLAASFSFSSYFLARMIKAVGRPHELMAAMQSDMSGLNRYSWRTLFWAGFALFYVAPTSSFVSRYLGAFGSVMCLVRGDRAAVQVVRPASLTCVDRLLASMDSSWWLPVRCSSRHGASWAIRTSR